MKKEQLLEELEQLSSDLTPCRFKLKNLDKELEQFNKKHGSGDNEKYNKLKTIRYKLSDVIYDIDNLILDIDCK